MTPYDAYMKGLSMQLFIICMNCGAEVLKHGNLSLTSPKASFSE